jgi:glycosyltransferase involved in cell wall biosynthesis
MIDVCLCTHEPAQKVLKKVLAALQSQTLPRDQFNLLVIDNASSPALHAGMPLFAPLISAGYKLKFIRETQLGISHARIAALSASRSEALIFVDDDNILHSNFLENAMKILRRYPEVGCFSGKIKLVAETKIPGWILELSSSVAARDQGEKQKIAWFRGKWAPWVPACGAGMVLRKEVARLALAKYATSASFHTFGRKGKNGLLAGEDFLIALCAAEAGFKCGYFPALQMDHFLHGERLNLHYFTKLMRGFAKSDLLRERFLAKKPKAMPLAELGHRLLAKDYAGKDARARFCHWIYQVEYAKGKLMGRLAGSASRAGLQ